MNETQTDYVEHLLSAGVPRLDWDGLVPDVDTYEYNAGWKSGLRGSDNALDRADRSGRGDEWYWGYFDAANSRPKNHSLTCHGCDEFCH